MTIDLYVVAKLALKIMGHGLGDFGTPKSDFISIQQNTRSIYIAPSKNFTLISLKILQNIVGILRTDPVECYRELVF